MVVVVVKKGRSWSLNLPAFRLTPAQSELLSLIEDKSEDQHFLILIFGI